MNDALTLDGLTKTYLKGTPGEVQVLRGASLALKPGEAVALVAPSGAGKSTLLHIAGLLDTPDTGQVAIGGRDDHMTECIFRQLCSAVSASDMP